MATCKIEKKDVSINTANNLKSLKFSRGGTGNLFLDFYTSPTQYYRLGFFKDVAKIFLEDHTVSPYTVLWTGTLNV